MENIKEKKEEKSFIDDMTPKQAFLMGISWGIAIICAVGFFVLLIGKVPGKIKTNDSKVNDENIQQENKKEGDVTKISPVTEDDHIRGDKNAKITLIEYSDYQCPFCSKLEPILEKILNDYNGKVRLIYRNYPLTGKHPYAEKAAEAAECAADQGRFWEMHDKIFANQSALNIDNLKSYAKDIELDSSQFNNCLDSGKYTSRISQQIAEAESAGLTGTPGTFVNDRFVNGAYPYETFKAIIDILLKKD